jgi:hypothetical protein
VAQGFDGGAAFGAVTGVDGNHFTAGMYGFIQRDRGSVDFGVARIGPVCVPYNLMRGPFVAAGRGRRTGRCRCRGNRSG